MSNVIGIYQITSPSGKVYIGQSWDIERRWYMYSLGHCAAQRHLHNSIKKYGFESHSREVLQRFTADVAQTVLDSREQFFMDLRRRQGVPLLNLRGGGSTGKLSDETKQKLREANLGKRASEQTRQRQSEWQLGLRRPHITESNKRRAAAGRLFQDYVRPKGKDHPRFGTRHTPESLAKMSACHKGQVITPEHRARVSQKVRGEGNAAAILTENQVLEIRAKYKPYKYQQSTLAKEYGVSRATISGIVDGRLWKHLLQRNHEWSNAA
jgi:group I intron endonuclease